MKVKVKRKRGYPFLQITHPAQERLDTAPYPSFSKSVVSISESAVRRDLVFRRYPRRLESNRLQIRLKRQNFSLSYLKTLSDGLAGI